MTNEEIATQHRELAKQQLRAGKAEDQKEWQRLEGLLAALDRKGMPAPKS